MPKYSIKIERITVQPDKFKPVSLAPVELEVIRFKRVKVGLRVVRERKVSKFMAIVEFRGRILILTRSEGLCDAFSLGEIVWNDCERIYGEGFLNFLDANKDGRICEYAVLNPDELVGYFHYIHNTGLETDWDT